MTESKKITPTAFTWFHGKDVISFQLFDEVCKQWKEHDYKGHIVIETKTYYWVSKLPVIAKENVSGVGERDGPSWEEKLCLLSKKYAIACESAQQICIDNNSKKDVFWIKIDPSALPPESDKLDLSKKQTREEFSAFISQEVIDDAEFQKLMNI